jgi:hypothetical protein
MSTTTFVAPDEESYGIASPPLWRRLISGSTLGPLAASWS